MRTLLERPSATDTAGVRDGSSRRLGAAVGRFAAHLVEMCMVMCAGAVVLSVAFFGGARLLGFGDVTESQTELAVLVIAVNLSVPMLAWMRFRGMAWEPTLEMAGATMLLGLALVTGSWLGVLAQDQLIGIETSLACPVMVVVMLLRFRLYSGGHAHHANTH